MCCHAGVRFRVTIALLVCSIDLEAEDEPRAMYCIASSLTGLPLEPLAAKNRVVGRLRTPFALGL